MVPEGCPREAGQDTHAARGEAAGTAAQAPGHSPFRLPVLFRVVVVDDLAELGEDLVNDIFQLLEPVWPHLRDVVHHDHRVDAVGFLGPVFEDIAQQLWSGRSVSGPPRGTPPWQPGTPPCQEPRAPLSHSGQRSADLPITGRFGRIVKRDFNKENHAGSYESQ